MQGAAIAAAHYSLLAVLALLRCVQAASNNAAVNVPCARYLVQGLRASRRRACDSLSACFERV